MSMPPDEWQARLERHFAELKASRSQDALPVFALEHGLNEAELSEIGSYLRQRLARGLPLHPHWLLWAVYATEIGYLYDGRDYWPPFEERTPYWRQNGSPAQLKGWFTKFQRVFHGVTPSGPWAMHFNRIAWPITHAVLPKLLQDQFAQALLDVSWDVARATDLDAVSAGKMLSKYSWRYSSRFQEFVQQEELTGRIVLALLDKKSAGNHDPIYSPTLDRIVGDLIKVRAAGAWLTEARRIVANRFYGVDRSRPVEPGGWDHSATEYSGTRKGQLDIRPTITLRRSAINTWTADINVPTFGGVAQFNPALSQYLKAARCRVAGAGASLMPPGWLLYGPQTRLLKSWPLADEMLISFDQPNATLENLLRSETRFSSGPTWVFRVGNDGMAREIESRGVRAGYRYVVIGRGIPALNLEFATASNIECEGVEALQLVMPEFVTPEATQELKKLGIEVIKSIRIWPAGLCIRNWDGEGHGNWLSTEAPCFGIIHDHAVDEYFVRLNNAPEISFEGVRAKDPLFIRLPLLSPGRHTLSVRARRIGISPSPSSIETQGRIELNVRDPAHWKPGTTQHSGLYVETDPHEPTLDDFWEGNVGVSVQGPDGHSIVCTISLSDSNNSTILHEEIGKFDLPVKNSAWVTKFKNFANNNARAWKYLDASSGLFSIKGEELGEFKLRLERDLKPIRWICKATSQATQIRVVDDTDSEETVEALFYPFANPGASVVLDANDAHSGISVAEPGGLYFARQGAHHDGLVVSSSRHANEFGALLVQPDLSAIVKAADPNQVLSLLGIWHQARLAGSLPDIRRENIVRHLLTCFYEQICGQRWMSGESALRNSPHSQSNLDRLKAGIEGPRNSLPAVLLMHPEILKQSTGQIQGWFSEKASRYGVCNDQQLSSFAIRVATDPLSLVGEQAKETPVLLEKLRSQPQLIRMARLFTLSPLVAQADARNVQGAL